MGTSASSSRIATIESAPHNASSVLMLSVDQGNDNTYFHANEYIRLSVEQIPQPSSVHREERYKEIGPPHQLQDIMKILGDTKDKEYPIYRLGARFVLSRARARVCVCVKREREREKKKAFSPLSLGFSSLLPCFTLLAELVNTILVHYRLRYSTLSMVQLHPMRETPARTRP